MSGRSVADTAIPRIARRPSDSRRLIAGLRSLREPPPSRLAARTLERIAPTDAYAELPGPIGPLYVAFGPAGISMIERAGDPAAFEAEFEHRFGRPIRRVERAPADVVRVVDGRIQGTLSAGDRRLRLDLSRLGEFERAVLLKALEIPRGEVRPYGWLAAEVGRPRAVRAVGNVMARNPIPFVIPCHRVVRSDGRIGEYGAGGPASKRAVLESEGVDLEDLEQLPRAGVRYVGSDTTRVYCYPTCHRARRISRLHRVPFRSGGDARRAGYRACRVCRPVEVNVRAA